MEQYSGMGEEMPNYSLWEVQDYYGGMVTQALSGSNEAPTNYYGKNDFSINADENHATAQPADAARNVYHVASSPEAANPAGSPGKAKRRRSKGGAAASQSTTFLNASISNFRALVQQHTGCHNANSSPKGPITLCFAAPAASTHEARHSNKQYY